MNRPTPDEEDFLQPLRRSPRAEAPPFLFTRIEARLHAATEHLQSVSPRRLAWVSAAAVLLVLLNVAAWQQLSQRTPSSSTPDREILGTSVLDAYSASS